MKITVGELKRIIREAAGDLQPTTDLQDITTPREKKNGTTALQDPVTGDVYKTNTTGYVRRYRPDWELESGYGKTFQQQQPVMILAPRAGTGKPKFDPRAGRVVGGGSWNRGQDFDSPEAMQAAQQAAIKKSVAKRRADLGTREKQASDYKARDKAQRMKDRALYHSGQ